VARSIASREVIEQLYDLFLRRGVPEHMRSDNGSEFTAKAIRKWLADLKVTTLYPEPGSPRENGYNESFNGKLQDELLKREIFMTLREARILAERWRYEYNNIRPHRSLAYRPPTPEAKIPVDLTLWVVTYLGAGHLAQEISLQPFPLLLLNIEIYPHYSADNSRVAKFSHRRNLFQN
jgi:putative transposase